MRDYEEIEIIAECAFRSRSPFATPVAAAQDNGADPAALRHFPDFPCHEFERMSQQSFCRRIFQESVEHYLPACR